MHLRAWGGLFLVVPVFRNAAYFRQNVLRVSFLMDERIDKGTGTTIGSTHDDLSVRTDLNCNGFPLTVDNFVRNGKTHTYCTSGL